MLMKVMVLVLMEVLMLLTLLLECRARM